jgi:tRNA pseudouridine38-40 synthase
MSQRLKLIVAYDGAPFGGWQSQKHHNTIQDELERAFRKISGERVRVHGSGRTDAGVHALAQCAHVDVPDRRFSVERWRNALNAMLPATIRILRCRYVSPDFHARFSAKGKTYRYRIWTGPVLPPLELNRAWHIRTSLDVDLLKAAGRNFIGKHNFAAFAANRGVKEENTTRTISSLDIRQRGPELAFEVTGDGFLYKMVRLMVGAMVQVALGKMEVREVNSRLESGELTNARPAAPSCGLYLVKVWY